LEDGKKRKKKQKTATTTKRKAKERKNKVEHSRAHLLASAHTGVPLMCGASGNAQEPVKNA
jgi:hypothetical protein